MNREYKAAAKQHWSKLSDQQISDTLGKREQLSIRVRQISDWQSKQAENPAPAKS